MPSNVTQLRPPWQKGQSGNPSGRPKQVREFARIIAERTADGAELIEFALGVWRDPDQWSVSQEQRMDGVQLRPDERIKLRWRAFEYLTDRYLGRVAQTLHVESEDAAAPAPAFDVRKLSDAQLKALTDALEAGKAG